MFNWDICQPLNIDLQKKQLGMLPSCACAVLDVILELQVLLEEAEKWYTPRTCSIEAVTMSLKNMPQVCPHDFKPSKI